MGESYDRLQIHRHRTFAEATRENYSQYSGELFVTVDGSSPKVFVGDGTTAGGFLVGPLGGFSGVEKLNSDIGPVTAIPWTAEPVETEDFEHDNSVNPSEVTILVGGLYSIRCYCTVLFAVPTTFTIQIQEDQGTGTWKNINGGGTIETGIAADVRSLATSRMFVFATGEKCRVVGSNGLLTTTNTTLVANYCSFEIIRIR